MYVIFSFALASSKFSTIKNFVVDPLSSAERTFWRVTAKQRIRSSHFFFTKRLRFTVESGKSRWMVGVRQRGKNQKSKNQNQKNSAQTLNSTPMRRGKNETNSNVPVIQGCHWSTFTKSFAMMWYVNVNVTGGLSLRTFSWHPWKPSRVFLHFEFSLRTV